MGLVVTRFTRVPEVSFERKYVRQNNIREGPVPRFAEIGREIELEFERSYEHQPIEFKGFPQGSGVSPVLFNFVFEVAALRGHFLKINPECKVISYADDFLVFSKTPMREIMTESTEMLAHGLKFNLEKSRQLKEDGTWLTSGFKFLGITFMTLGNLSLIGTPRSGKTLPFDKEDMVTEFAARNIQLGIIGKPCGLAPGVILALWGQGIEPAASLPMEFIKGEAPLTEEQMMEFSKLFLEAKPELSKFKKDNSGAGNLDPSETGIPSGALNLKDLKPGNLDATIESLRREGNLSFLGRELDGLIVNRLHGGSWVPELAEAKRDLESKPRSWLSFKTNTVWQTIGSIFPSKLRARVNMGKLLFIRDNLSIYNSTSIATVDLLRAGRNQKVLKVRHNELLHSVL